MRITKRFPRRRRRQNWGIVNTRDGEVMQRFRKLPAAKQWLDSWENRHHCDGSRLEIQSRIRGFQKRGPRPRLTCIRYENGRRLVEKVD